MVGKTVSHHQIQLIIFFFQQTKKKSATERTCCLVSSISSPTSQAMPAQANWAARRYWFQPNLSNCQAIKSHNPPTTSKHTPLRHTYNKSRIQICFLSTLVQRETAPHRESSLCHAYLYLPNAHKQNFNASSDLTMIFFPVSTHRRSCCNQSNQ